VLSPVLGVTVTVVVSVCVVVSVSVTVDGSAVTVTVEGSGATVTVVVAPPPVAEGLDVSLPEVSSVLDDEVLSDEDVPVVGATVAVEIGRHAVRCAVIASVTARVWSLTACCARMTAC